MLVFADMAYLLFELCSSHRIGSGAFFFAFGGLVRNCWYGFVGPSGTVIWTTCCLHGGGGTIHTITAKAKHTSTASCLLDTVPLVRELALEFDLGSGDHRVASY